LTPRAVRHEVGGVEADGLLTKVRAYFSRQCDGGDSLSCVSLGVIYSTGEGARADRARARELFGRACDLKNPMGCQQAEALRD
jgi:TPR repeat protein